MSATEQVPDHAIVVGFDGSTPSQVALEWAVETARDRGLGVHILAARDSERADDVAAVAAQQVRQNFPDVTVTSSAPVGNPRYLLVDASDCAAAIVVGNRGRSRWRAAILGTTSFSTAQHANCPVVIVKDGRKTATPPLRVVVGVDGSGSSSAAIAYGLRLAAPNARVSLLMAWSTAGSDAQLPPFARDLVERTLGDRDLSGVRREDVAIEVKPGHPVDVLTQASSEADLLVMGRSGSGGFTGLGSTASHILGEAACPVMLIPGGDSDE